MNEEKVYCKDGKFIGEKFNFGTYCNCRAHVPEKNYVTGELKVKLEVCEWLNDKGECKYFQSKI